MRAQPPTTGSCLTRCLQAAVAAVLFVVGLLAELISINRILLEDIRGRLREREYQEHSRHKDH